MDKNIKRILFIHAGAELYGADNILLKTIEGLDKEKFCPVVLLPNNGPLVDELMKLDVKVIVDDFPIIRRKYFTPIGMIDYGTNFLISLKKIKKVIKENNIDIITSNTLAVLEGAIISKLSGTKHVWHIHEIIKEPRIMDKFYKKIVPALCQNAICVSQAVKDNLFTEDNKCNAEVIHNGIDVASEINLSKLEIRKSLGIDEDTIVIGMIGRVNKIKGQNFLLDAAKELVENHPNIVFVMVGGVFQGQEQLLDELKEKISEYKLEKNVKIYDFDKSVEKYYKIFDIFALPSVKPDSFPTVVLEAMGYGLPIVANVTGGVSEMVKDNVNGYLINDITVENMVEKLEILVNSSSVRSEYGNKSKEIMTQYFSSSTFNRKINNFYNKL